MLCEPPSQMDIQENRHNQAINLLSFIFTLSALKYGSFKNPYINFQYFCSRATTKLNIMTHEHDHEVNINYCDNKKNEALHISPNIT